QNRNFTTNGGLSFPTMRRVKRVVYAWCFFLIAGLYGTLTVGVCKAIPVERFVPPDSRERKNQWDLREAGPLTPQGQIEIAAIGKFINRGSGSAPWLVFSERPGA